ncbi:Calcium/calmodulin-dependent protein kinase type 1, partial [Pelomyxa schiedti]
MSSTTTASGGGDGGSFRYVCVPCDLAEVPTELRQEWGDDLVGCLVRTLQAHFKRYDAANSGKVSKADKDEGKRALRDQIQARMPSGSTISDEQLETISETSHIVDTIPLVMNTPASGYIGINMYVSDMGKIKGMPYNKRASEICTLAGRPTDVYGDCFIARVFDDNKDDFRRLDFTLSELSSSASWLTMAASVAASRPDNTEQLMRLMAKAKSPGSSVVRVDDTGKHETLSDSDFTKFSSDPTTAP